MQITKPAKSAAQNRIESLIGRLGAQWGVDAAKLRSTLVNTVFRQGDGTQPTNEELMVVLLVCEQFSLNPFAREIFAFKAKGGQIVPVVSLDGWAKIVRRQKDFNGMRFRVSERTVEVAGRQLPEFCECSIFLKGIDEPVSVQEYAEECFNERSPVWNKWPRRMLRTRAFIQAARLAFSLTGLYDEGDAFGSDGPVQGEGMRTAYAADTLPPETPVLPESRTAPAIGFSLQKADDRLAILLRSRAIPNFWTRAAASVNRAADLTPDEKKYVLARLEETRAGEEAASAEPRAEQEVQPQAQAQAVEPSETVREPDAPDAADAPDAGAEDEGGSLGLI